MKYLRWNGLRKHEVKRAVAGILVRRQRRRDDLTAAIEYALENVYMGAYKPTVSGWN